MSLRNVVPCACALLAAGLMPGLAQVVQDRGCTGELPPDTSSEFTDETARTSCTPAGAAATTLVPRATTDPAWDLLAEQPVFQRLAKSERCAVQFDATTATLLAINPADVLTAGARVAVNRAPTWLHKQLEDQFSRMNAAQQDKWAQWVNDAAEPYVDETAFLVAHIAREDLASPSFFPRLIRDTREYAYEVDPFLDYVRVVDHGSAAEGGDYYTALAYRVELDGQVTEIEYPREFYYWWVLHPRGSDEFPTYIDPVPCSSGGTPAAPPTGKFWREWLFYGASNKYGACDTDWDGAHDDPCPVMKDVLAGIDILWAHRGNTSGPANGAVGVINQWVRDSIGPFGDQDLCRPVQPVLVYYHTDGNCGEWADLTMAAGRAALIPTEVTGTQANDHVWNEFYDAQWGRWVQWEPVNNMIDSNYSGWWGGKIAATHTLRGDGWGHTDITSQHGPSATLTVTVYDANHYRVDGAEVVLGTDWDALPGLITSISKAHTDAQGQARFTLGDTRSYYVYVNTSWGRYPASGWGQVVSDAVGGAAYDWSPPDFSGAVPRLSISPDTSPGTGDDHLLEVESSVLEGYVHGSGFQTSTTYAKDLPGDIDFFIADEDNWDLFTAGSAFQAFRPAIDSPAQAESFVPPDPVSYYVAWSNKAAMDMAHVVHGTVRLYRNNGSVPQVLRLAVGKDAENASLLDWEDVTGLNVDGYDVYRSGDAASVAEALGEPELEPYLLAHTAGSEYRDPPSPAPGTCFFYSVRTHSRR